MPPPGLCEGDAAQCFCWRDCSRPRRPFPQAEHWWELVDRWFPLKFEERVLDVVLPPPFGLFPDYYDFLSNVPGGFRENIKLPNRLLYQVWKETSWDRTNEVLEVVSGPKHFLGWVFIKAVLDFQTQLGRNLGLFPGWLGVGSRGGCKSERAEKNLTLFFSVTVICWNLSTDMACKIELFWSMK